jgi:hypothetical protein
MFWEGFASPGRPFFFPTALVQIFDAGMAGPLDWPGVHAASTAFQIVIFAPEPSWGGSSVFEWLCCVCSQTRLGPGPRQQGRQVQEEGFPTLGTER